MKNISYLIAVFLFSAMNSFGQTTTFTIPTPVGSPGIGYQSLSGCKGTGIVLDDGVSTNTSDASAIWCNSHTIDLSQSFETRFNMRFGNVGAGAADGITFTLQREGLGALEATGTGGRLGVSSNWLTGIDTSVIIEFDIFDNSTAQGDIAQNHVAISYNGNIQNPIVPASAITLSNNIWHGVRIHWDACANQLTVWLDDVVVSTLNADLVEDVFGGNPEDVIFGFTSASASSNTSHQICFVDHTATPCLCDEIPNPTMNLFSPVNCGGFDETCCIGAEVETNSSVSGSLIIDWGDGHTSTTNTHTYSNSGSYGVTAYVQYHLLSDPSNCCIKEVQAMAIVECGKGKGKSSEKSLNALPEDKEVTVYPNPIEAGSTLTLDHTEKLVESTFSVFDINGKEIINVSHDPSSTLIEIQIPLNLDEGIYFLKDSKDQFKPIKFSVRK